MERTHSSRSLKRKESSSSKGGENFKVAVRVRPLIVHEMKDNVNQVSRRCHCSELASDLVHEVHLLAKKDIEIQPGFEPGSSEFRSDALTN